MRKTLIIGIVLSMCAANAFAGNVIKGKQTFKENCVICHGMDGSGNTDAGKAIGAADLRSAAVQALTDQQIHDQVENGGKKMPAFGGMVSEAQIADLIAYIRTFGGTK